VRFIDGRFVEGTLDGGRSSNHSTTCTYLRSQSIGIENQASTYTINGVYQRIALFCVLLSYISCYLLCTHHHNIALDYTIRTSAGAFHSEFLSLVVACLSCSY